MKSKMKRTFVLLLSSIVAILSLTTSALFGQESIENETKTLNEREFKFHYAASIQGLENGSRARVWIPIAQSTADQQIRMTGASTPSPMQINKDTSYGNDIGYFELTATDTGLFAFRVNYEVLRSEAGVDSSAKHLTAEQRQLFLKPNRLVPISGRPIELLKNDDLPAEPMSAGSQLYELVEQHMKYDKSKPGYGNGDSVWACNSKTGNCTDFHSLFISLARSRKLPARFEIGFPLSADKTEGKIGGYHCWAWFHAENYGWCPVDISEADKHPELKNYYFGKLTPDRIAFSTGRDIELVPKSTGGPLNYFIYPHVEVDGKVWPRENIKLSFSFEATD